MVEILIGIIVSIVVLSILYFAYRDKDIEEKELDRACVKCKHYRRSYDEYYDFHQCKHPNIRTNYNDLVLGKVISVNKECSIARSKDDLCGKEGIYWEPK